MTEGAENMFDMFAAHVWSEENEEADALSRLSEGANRPAACAAAQEWDAVRLQRRFIGTKKRKHLENRLKDELPLLE